MLDIPSLTSDDRAPKLAQQVAARIEQDIIRLGWPVGRNLGSEAELASRYGVGRWVLREAISIAACDGLLEIQRGRYGGLLVSAPAAEAVVVAIHNYLEFCQLAPAILLDARLVLESLAFRLAASRINAQSGLDLRRAAVAACKGVEAAYQGDLLRALLTAAGNQVIAVFVHALLEATRSSVRRQHIANASIARRTKDLMRLRAEQVEAVLAGDAHRIHALQIDYVAIWRELLAQPRLSGARTASSPNGASKRSEQMSQGLLAKIAELGWPRGYSLGSEAELMAEFGVSRAVLREAIRPLERHGVVEMRPGRGARSGLRVGKPNPGATVRTVARFLKYSRVPLADIYDVQQALEDAASASAAALEDQHRIALGNTLLALANGARPQDLVAVEQYMWDFYQTLGSNCGNPVYGLFMRILVDMSGLVVDEAPSPALDAGLIDANCSACLSLAQAIRDGDQALARRYILDWRKVSEAMSPRERPLEQIMARELKRDDH